MPWHMPKDMVKVWFQNRRTKHKRDKERQAEQREAKAESLATQNLLHLLQPPANHKSPSPPKASAQTGLRNVSLPPAPQPGVVPGFGALASDLYYDIEESPKASSIFQEIQSLMAEEQKSFEKEIQEIFSRNKVNTQQARKIKQLLHSQRQQQKSSTSTERKDRILLHLFHKKAQTTVAVQLHRDAPVDLMPEWIARVWFGHTNRFQSGRAILKAMSPTPPPDADPDLEVTDLVFNDVPMSWKNRPDTSLGTRRYRLAPEHPFPAPLDDCVAAIVHVLKNGHELGIDTNKVGVAGLSAGGNLAATVSLRLQEPEFQTLPKLRYQVLLMASLQAVDLNLPSTANEVFTGGLLSREDMASFLLSYAGLDLSPDTVQQVMRNQHVLPETKARLAKYVHRNLVKEELERTSKTLKIEQPAENQAAANRSLAALAEPIFLNPLFSPLLAEESSLQRLPRTMVVSARYDVLRDDSLLFVRRLRAARVPVTSLLLETAHHISLAVMMPDPASEMAKDAYEKMFDFMKQAVNS
nr:hypothetical protein BaRGS_031302 [Batillaria attramentaria]KAG5700962.1 hypothetical protein BaRGS_034247 [Batillaria attramentaria]